MKKLLPLIACAFLLVGCDDIEGTLSISEPLNLKAKKTGLFQSGTKDVSVPAATYQAKLSPKSATELDLKLKANGKDLQIPFKLPKGTQIPSFEGQLDILADQSGQPYDLHADVKSDVSNYNYDRTEQCVAGYIPERQCISHPGNDSCIDTPARTVCDNGDNHEHGPHYNPPTPSTPAPANCREIPARRDCTHTPPYTTCDIVQVPVYGSQIVNYQDTSTVKHIVVTFTAAGRPVGQFNHSDTKTSTARVGSSFCTR